MPPISMWCSVPAELPSACPALIARSDSEEAERKLLQAAVPNQW